MAQRIIVDPMSASVIQNLRGGPLAGRDYEALAVRWIDREWAGQQMLRRVTSIDGSEILGRKGAGSYSGIAIPYIWPGDSYVREYRFRRDSPDYEDGKPKRKYMAPPGRGNLLYLPIGIGAAWLADVTLPVALTEGEFKANQPPMRLNVLIQVWRGFERAEWPNLTASDRPGRGRRYPKNS